MTNTDPALFVTGGSGFVGRAFLARLAGSGVRDVRYLARSPASLRDLDSGTAEWTRIEHGLEDIDRWADALPPGGTVVHLAAQTGKASRKRHFEVNAEATGRLVRHARERGVGRMVFVSSIAAGFGDQRAYPYAQSKARAERHVREGGLPWTIVRPTQVFGPGSAVQEGLRKLSCGPVGVRFGRGEVAFQPVQVDDLAARLETIATHDAFLGRVVEVGGPEALPVAELMERLRRRERGSSGPWITLPVGPIRTLLSMLEPLFLPLLPLTAGQLSSFVEGNGGSARPDPAEHLFERPGVSLTAMLEESLDG